MNEILNRIRKDKITFTSAIGSCLFLFIAFIGILIFYSNLPPFMPIFNQSPWGYARFGTKAEFFIPIAAAVIFSIADMFLAERLYGKMPLLSRFLAVASLAISLFACIFTFQIIRIVL